LLSVPRRVGNWLVSTTFNGLALVIPIYCVVADNLSIVKFYQIVATYYSILSSLDCRQEVTSVRVQRRAVFRDCPFGGPTYNI
jgi:hypothetical protein